MYKKLKLAVAKFAILAMASLFFCSITHAQTQWINPATWIRKDGSTVTTAEIPFELGITVDGTVTIEDMTSAGFVKNDGSGVLSGGNSVDISDDSNLAVDSPITLTGDTLDFDFSTNNTWTGTQQIDNTVTVGIDDTGHDVTLYGATSGSFVLFDESADDVILDDYQLVLTGSSTAKNEALIVFQGAVQRPVGMQVTAEFLNNGWSDLYGVNFGGTFTTNTAVTSVAGMYALPKLSGDGAITNFSAVHASPYAFDVSADDYAITTMRAVWAHPVNFGTDTTTIVGVDIDHALALATGGSITNNYGLRISNITTGDTLNYSIYTNAGEVSLGDDLTIRSGDLTIADMSSAGFVKNDSSGVFSGGNSIDLSDDVNLTVTTPITLTGDDVGFDYTTANTWTGTQQVNNTLAVGTDGSGFDFTVNSDTSGASLYWEAAARNLKVGYQSPLHLGCNDDRDGLCIITRNTAASQLRGAVIWSEYNGSNTTNTAGTVGLNSFAHIESDDNISRTSTYGGASGGRYVVRSYGSGLISLGTGISTTFSLEDTGDFTEWRGVQSEAVSPSSGEEVNTFTDFYAGGINPASTTTTAARHGLWVKGATSVGGTFTNEYGVKIEDIDQATNNFSIYTGAGDVRFGGDVIIDADNNGSPQDNGYAFSVQRPGSNSVYFEMCQANSDSGGCSFFGEARNGPGGPQTFQFWNFNTGANNDGFAWLEDTSTELMLLDADGNLGVAADVDVGDELSIPTDKCIYFEGPASDTKLCYNSTDSQLELTVDGTLEQEWGL